MKYLFILIFLLITGCSTTKPESNIVIKNKLTTVEIPETLMKSCRITEPPEKIKYLNSELKMKESILTDYSISLINDIDICNDQLNSIRRIYNDFMKQLKEHNEKTF